MAIVELLREAVKAWEAWEMDAAESSDMSPWSNPESAAKRARLYGIVDAIGALTLRDVSHLKEVAAAIEKAVTANDLLIALRACDPDPLRNIAGRLDVLLWPVASASSGLTPRPQHEVWWEDARMAGVNCNGVDVGTITTEEIEPWVCGLCGARLRLVWDVRLEEVTPEQETK